MPDVFNSGPPAYAAGDRVLVQAVVASIDHKKRTAKVAVGWGPTRSIITVPLALLERPIPKAIKEAATWANDLYGGQKRGH